MQLVSEPDCRSEDYEFMTAKNHLMENNAFLSRTNKCLHNADIFAFAESDDVTKESAS